MQKTGSAIDVKDVPPSEGRWFSGGFNSSWLSLVGAHVRRTLLGLPVDRLLSKVDDPEADPGMRFRLLRALQVGLRSYNVALEASLPGLGLHLDSLAPELRGIGVEGAATALFLLDSLRAGRRRLRPFLDGPYAPYIVFTHAGCGMMLAQFRRPIAPYLRVFSDLSSSMVINSYGFGRTALERHLRPFEVAEPPRSWTAAQQRIFNQGAGRALVFKLCGRIPAIAAAIRRLPGERQRDIWAGVGSAIAINVGEMEARSARQALLSYNALPWISPGVCKATWVHAHAGSRTHETDLVAELLVGHDVQTQLDLVKSHAPTETSVSPERWLAWWDNVSDSFLRSPLSKS